MLKQINKLKLCWSLNTNQELGGAEDVKCEGLDSGVMDAQLSVDPRTLDAGQDAQVGGEPRGA